MSNLSLPTRKKRTMGDVEKEVIDSAADELHGFFEELKLEGQKTGNRIEDLEKLEEEFGNLILTASNNDENIVKVTDSIAKRVKINPRVRKPTQVLGYGGRKQRGGNFTCTTFRKKLIKLLIIAGLFTGVYAGSGAMYSVFEGFFSKAFGLLSADIQRSLGDLATAVNNYIKTYIKAAIDTLRMSVELNNSTLWEAFLNSLSWTNFGKLFAAITALDKARPAIKDACGQASETLDSIVENICKELESKFKTTTSDSGTQTDLSDAKEKGEDQANRITNYFTRSSCSSNDGKAGGRKSRRRSIKKNRKTRRKTSSKKTNKKRRRSKRKTSRR